MSKSEIISVTVFAAQTGTTAKGLELVDVPRLLHDRDSMSAEEIHGLVFRETIVAWRAETARETETGELSTRLVPITARGDFDGFGDIWAIENPSGSLTCQDRIWKSTGEFLRYAEEVLRERERWHVA